MKLYLLLAAAVLASPSTFAGGFLDLGHHDWGAFLVRGYANNPAVPPKPAEPESVPVPDTSALPVPDLPAPPEASSPTPNPSFPTGAPRHITPGVSP